MTASSTSPPRKGKQELRLAVVIYGGASLAIYMHAVTKELLKLVRASKALHELDRAGGLKDTSRYADCGDDRRVDTEAVYFDVLRQINSRSHFRVVIDVIAGASAGAINGLMLGKALVDDALLEAHTDLWLAQADTEQLSRENVRWWRKWYLYPFLRLFTFLLPGLGPEDSETRSKLTRLMRSSWFRPPFSGKRLCHHFFDALGEMRRTRRPDSALLPDGQRLDVYASLTDLYGYPRAFRLNEGISALEREHGAYCRLSHLQGDAGRDTSDLADDNLPGLVWAARASSSYAGAFPPFRHAEVTEVLAERQTDWPREAYFVANCLFDIDGAPLAATFDPRERDFVDGGIVNNKPFEIALEALNHRPADRHVERCIAYIEPNPNVEDVRRGDRKMGYLSTIRAALSTIPRNQPILSELREISAIDRRARNNRRLVDGNRQRIREIVEQAMADTGLEADCGSSISALRLRLANVAHAETGLAYEAYAQRRVWRLSEALAREWLQLAPEPDKATEEAMLETIRQWWSGAGEPLGPTGEIGVLDRFDVSFRIRRLLFVIRRLNQHESVMALELRSQDLLDRFKLTSYQFLARLYELRKARGLNSELIALLGDAASRVPLPATEALALMDRLADVLGLALADMEFDNLFHQLCADLVAADAADLSRSLLADYLGFPLYDVLLLTSENEQGGPDPLTPVRVERISPADARSLGSVFKRLKCRDFMGFLGFFNRSYREHDYLWGRLHGADRIMDLLERIAGADAPALAGARKRLFELILQRERQRLHECADTLQEVAEAVRRL